jgi:uncharacterized repeat protein (TIGR01451 family)
MTRLSVLHRLDGASLSAGCLAVVVALLTVVSSASAAAPAAGWSIASLAQPTNFSSADTARCEAAASCDSYTVTVTNAGSRATDGSTVTIVDTLPSAVRFVGVFTPTQGGSPVGEGYEWQGKTTFPCSAAEVSGRWQVTCTFEKPLPAGDVLQVRIMVAVTSSSYEEVRNEAQVEGGGVPVVKTSDPAMASATAPNTINGPPSAFGVQDFALAVSGFDGRPDLQAGDHAYELTSTFDLNSSFRPFPTSGKSYEATRTARDVVVYLPLGLVGDALATPRRCPEADLPRKACPPSSRVGTVTINTGGEPLGFNKAPIFNVQPESGYPAEFGFTGPAEKEVMLFASVVPMDGGYAVRVASPGILNGVIGEEDTIMGSSLTFFGDPAAHNGEGSASAFYANPTRCTSEPLKARIEADSWHEPGVWRSKEATVYPQIEGCNMLQFNPTIELQPQTTQADTPSGYEVELKVPQAPNVFGELATPDLKNATVTLPRGVSLSPSAANGLVGCKETAPEGIEFPKGGLPPTQAGEGEEIGPDGLSRPASGHCPEKSQIGTVEIETPLLPQPLTGHVYVSQPNCGGPSQRACETADAANGELYGLYLEVSGSGVIVKLKGKVSADPATGQLTTTFAENPQLPFEDLKLKLTGREPERAPLANPQSCEALPLDSQGRPVARTASLLEPWGGPNAEPTAEFPVTGCVNPVPFAPSFLAQSQTPIADGFSPFTMTLSRKDGEQNLGGVSLTMPAGMAGMLSKVPLCPEPQASLGACGAESGIGTANVAAGAGSEPLWLSGPVYLTGPYNGAPFGLSVVVPAVAGPFNLGNVVERAAINVDPHTAQVTVTSDPLPQIRDGVPFRLKMLNVTIDREGFIFNPTNCSQMRVTGTISGVMPSTGAPGSSVAVSSPFAVAGCKNLPFKPKFTVLTQAKTSKANGAYLHVKVASGPGQANIAKVKVDLPKQLPSRLTTLQKACTAAVFEANPANCSAASVVGTGTAVTPVLKNALTGPAYLVSHGGAAFPDLVVVLQGERITLDLVGNTNIKKGITSSAFNSVPDAPISTFDLVLPEGPHSALAANGNLCTQNLVMPTTIVGQNGAQVTQSTKIAVTGCKAVTITKRKLSGKNVVLSFFLTAKGTVTVTGNGLKKYRKTLGAGSHQINVALSKAGRSIRRHHGKIKIKVALRSGATRSSATTTLKL